jgi:prepilin-type N-terminal cleavage/methylation domain-containing protein
MIMSQKGFSLTEVLLSIGLISLVSASLYVVNIQYLHRNEMQDALTTLHNALNFAQSSAIAMRQDSEWGVHAAGSVITVFKGSTFSARETLHDDDFAVSPGVSITITNDIVYEKYTGVIPNAISATVTARNNESTTLQINTEGIINY